MLHEVCGGKLSGNCFLSQNLESDELRTLYIEEKKTMPKSKRLCRCFPPLALSFIRKDTQVMSVYVHFLKLVSSPAK